MYIRFIGKQIIARNRNISMSRLALQSDHAWHEDNIKLNPAQAARELGVQSQYLNGICDGARTVMQGFHREQVRLDMVSDYVAAMRKRLKHGDPGYEIIRDISHMLCRNRY